MSDDSSDSSPCPFLPHADAFCSVNVALYSSLWNRFEFDKILYTSLGGALMPVEMSLVEIIGLAARINAREILWYFLRPDAKHPFVEIREQFEKKVEETARNGRALPRSKPWHFELEEGVRVVLWEMLEMPNQAGLTATPADSPGARCSDYCALLYKKADGAKAGQAVSTPEDDLANEHNVVAWENYFANSLLGMFYDVFRHRERRMMPFAPKISRFYWDSVVAGRGIPQHAPPWNHSHPGRGDSDGINTVTLCVDLRKSTICMGQAYRNREFGEWLDELVRELINICHDHGGVFDKFTGDGGLMHFLDMETRETMGKPAIVVAANCAQALCLRLTQLMPRLRKILRNTTALMGAGIAVAQGKAYWSLDHHNNPIVVGPGVVDACRLCDQALAGIILMQNYAHEQLVEVNSIMAMPYRLIELGATKESADALRMEAWEWNLAGRCHCPDPSKK
jgi:class 3 adenylate cyclase